MKRLLLTSVVLAALAAVGFGGNLAGSRGLVLPGVDRLPGTAHGAIKPAATGAIVYYRHPDGRPLYSAQPRKAEDGHDFVAVRASQDLSLEVPRVETTEAKEERKLLYYRNPMGLPDTSPVPKKDSMGMDYLPVYADEATDPNIVTLSPGRIQRSGVRSVPVRLQPITRAIRVPGTVQLDERRVAVVATRSDAFIEEVAAITTGDKVSKGTSLVRIYSPEIAAAGAQFVTDLKAAARGIPEGGARQRLENLGVPPEVVAEIEQSRKVPLTINWPAPRDGIVLERNVVDGMKVAGGSSLFRLADISTIWVNADVPESELAAVRIGAPAKVRLRGRPGTVLEGVVGLIYPQVAEATRTTKVRIELANRDGVLLPNMYADVEIEAGDVAPALGIPDHAVIDTGTRRIVILDHGEGRFAPREVRLGQRGDGVVAVREGLVEGDRVVVSANFLIDAESNLKAALSALAAPEAKP